MHSICVECVYAEIMRWSRPYWCRGRGMCDYGECRSVWTIQVVELLCLGQPRCYR